MATKSQMVEIRDQIREELHLLVVYPANHAGAFRHAYWNLRQGQLAADPETEVDVTVFHVRESLAAEGKVIQVYTVRDLGPDPKLEEVR